MAHPDGSGFGSTSRAVGRVVVCRGEAEASPPAGGDQLPRPVVPSLSADRRLLGHRDQRNGHYVIRDVVSGQVTPSPGWSDRTSTQGPRSPTTRHSPPPFRAPHSSPRRPAPRHHRHQPGRPRRHHGHARAGPRRSVQPLATGKPFTLAGWPTATPCSGSRAASRARTRPAPPVITPVALAVDGGAHPLQVLRPTMPCPRSIQPVKSVALPDHLTLLLAYGPETARTPRPRGPRCWAHPHHRQQNSTTAAHGDVPMPGSRMARRVHSHGMAPLAVVPIDRRGRDRSVARPIGGPPTIVVGPRLNLGWLDLTHQALSGPRTRPCGTPINPGRRGTGASAARGGRPRRLLAPPRRCGAARPAGTRRLSPARMVPAPSRRSETQPVSGGAGLGPPVGDSPARRQRGDTKRAAAPRRGRLACGSAGMTDAPMPRASPSVSTQTCARRDSNP